VSEASRLRAYEREIVALGGWLPYEAPEPWECEPLKYFCSKAMDGIRPTLYVRSDGKVSIERA